MQLKLPCSYLPVWAFMVFFVTYSTMNPEPCVGCRDATHMYSLGLIPHKSLVIELLPIVHHCDNYHLINL